MSDKDYKTYAVFPVDTLGDEHPVATMVLARSMNEAAEKAVEHWHNSDVHRPSWTSVVINGVFLDVHLEMIPSYHARTVTPYDQDAAAWEKLMAKHGIGK